MRYLIIVLFLFSTSVFACEDEAYKQAVEDAGEYQDEADALERAAAQREANEAWK